MKTFRFNSYRPSIEWYILTREVIPTMNDISDNEYHNERDDWSERFFEKEVEFNGSKIIIALESYGGVSKIFDDYGDYKYKYDKNDIVIEGAPDNWTEKEAEMFISRVAAILLIKETLKESEAIVAKVSDQIDKNVNKN